MCPATHCVGAEGRGGSLLSERRHISEFHDLGWIFLFEKSLRRPQVTVEQLLNILLWHRHHVKEDLSFGLSQTAQHTGGGLRQSAGSLWLWTGRTKNHYVELHSLIPRIWWSTPSWWPQNHAELLTSSALASAVLRLAADPMLSPGKVPWLKRRGRVHLQGCCWRGPE